MSGRFQKGQSGNPGGKAKTKVRATIDGVEGEYTIAELMAEHIPTAIDAMARILGDEDSKDSDVIAVARDMFDRVFGKPRQAVEVTGEDGEPIEHLVTVQDVLAALPKVADEC